MARFGCLQNGHWSPAPWPFKIVKLRYSDRWQTPEVRNTKESRRPDGPEQLGGLQVGIDTCGIWIRPHQNPAVDQLEGSVVTAR